MLTALTVAGVIVTALLGIGFLGTLLLLFAVLAYGETKRPTDSGDE